MRHLLGTPYIPLREGERVRVAFLFQSASVWPSWETVYEAFLGDGHVDARLILQTQTAIERAQMRSARGYLDQRGYDYWTDETLPLACFRPHVVFVQFPYDLTFHTSDRLAFHLRQQGFRVAYIPYGIEISDTATSRRDHFENFVVENSWRIYTCCAAMREEYRKHCRNRAAVRAFGSPKFDALARRGRHPLDEGIARRVAGRKIIVWKIHFPKRILDGGQAVQVTPDMAEYLRFARRMEGHAGLYFVALVHPKLVYGIEPYDVQGDRALIWQAEALLADLRRKANVTVDCADDYRPSLYHADAIITDRSGTMVEAAMTGAPVLFMGNAHYRERWTPPVGKLAGSFYHGTSCRDMEAFLGMVARGEDPQKGRRLACIAGEFPYMDGQCGARIARDIIASLAEDQPTQQLRVALYAAGRICRYYLEEVWKDDCRFQVVALADSNAQNWGRRFCRMGIQPPDCLVDLDYDALVIMSDFHYFSIKKYLVYDLCLDERKIWRLDEFMESLDALSSAIAVGEH